MKIGKLYRDRAHQKYFFLIVMLEPAVAKYCVGYAFDFLYENSMNKSSVWSKEEFDKTFEEVE